jgi:hypothetical protein
LLDYEASPAFCSILTTSAVISDSHSDHRIDVSLTHRYFSNYLPGAFGDDRGQAGGAGLDGAMKMINDRMHKDEKTGRANGFTQGMNNLHQVRKDFFEVIV